MQSSWFRRAASSAAIALTIALPMQAQTPVKQASNAKLNDPTIVAIFDAANTWDIETGNLAVKKGSTKEVRDFGAMLARDHKNVRQQGRDRAAVRGGAESGSAPPA